MKRASRVAAAVLAMAVALVLLAGVGAFGVDDGESARPAALPVAAPAPGRLDGAIASLQRAARSRHDDWRALARLGLAYLEKARLSADPAYYVRAEKVLEASVELNREDNIDGALGLALLGAARHDFHQAHAWGRAARAIAPYDSDALGVVADALVELGRYRDARRAIQRMVDLRPDLASFARVSYFRELHGDVDGAIAAMTAAFEAVGGAGTEAAWASYQLGELYLDSGRLGRASYAYRRAAFLAPDYYLTRAGLARLAVARGDERRAIRLLSDLVETYPAPVYVMELGDVYAASGNRAAARAQYALVRVEERLARSSGVRPDVEVLNFYSDHGLRPRRTLRAARLEYGLRPSVRVADALAWALYSNGRYAEASLYASKAFRTGIRAPLFLFHSGMIATARGEENLARRHLRAALAANPRFSVLHAATARRTLARLEDAA